MMIFPLPWASEVSMATTSVVDNKNAEELLSRSITEARDRVENEFMTRGTMLIDDMRNAFNIESIESPLNLAYQYAFTGNISAAVSELQIAADALGSLAIDLAGTGQQMENISDNSSITADNSTRQMIAALGDALTQLGVSVDEIRQDLPTEQITDVR
jgi:hypothetical protein